MLGLPWLFPTRSEFARSVARAAESARPGTRAQLDEADFTLELLDGDGKSQARMMLENVYRDFQRARPWARSALIRRLVSVPTDPRVRHFFQAAPRLMPRIVDRMMLEAARLSSRSAPVMPHLPLASRFAVCLVLDDPDRMTFVTQEDLETWNRSFRECADLAIEHLEARCPQPFERLGRGLLSWSHDENYGAAVALLTSRLRMAFPSGQPVIALPNRGTLLAADGADAEALDALLDAAVEAAEGPRPMNAVPLVLSGETWVELEVPDDFPLARRLASVRSRADAESYAEQKEPLQQRLGDDVYVPGILGLGPAESMKTCAVWTRGVATSLPKVDQIAFHEPEGGTRIADWAAVARVLADTWTLEPDCYPVRYRVSGFPTEAQLAAMGATPLRDEG